MRRRNFKTTLIRVAILSSCAVLLASCGSGTNYELNLPGLGNVLANSKTAEPKMAKRSGLLIPPKLTKGLPTPGQQSASSQNLSWPDDPEVAKRQALANAKKKEQDYRDSGNTKTYSGVEEFNKNQEWIERQSGLADKLAKNKTLNLPGGTIKVE